MSYYHLTLELRSSLGTPLAADTLWGHVAWGIRYAQGESALLEWLDAHDSDKPPLVMSDPFPAGYWPRPKLPVPPRPETPPTRDQAQQHKSAQRVGWVPHPIWQATAGQLSARILSASLANAPEPHASVTIPVMHAAINRWTGGTAHSSGGGLYSREQTWFNGPATFDLWCWSCEELSTVRQWLEQGLAGGYGSDASTGLGHIVVKDVQHQPDWFNVPNANAMMALGAFIPSPRDPVQGWFAGNVKSGRVGGDFAIGAFPNGNVLRQKRLVRRLLPGSILLGTPNSVPWIGRNVRGVHRELDSIRQYGLTLTLPARVVEDFVSDKEDVQ